VRLLGYQPRDTVFAEARRHDLFLAPSLTAGDGDTEGTPVTIMEMMAAGIPVASTRHSDIPELVHHGRTGLLAPEHDPAALAATIEEHLDHVDLWRSMLDAARAHIEDGFDSVNQGIALARLYGEVVDGPAPGASADR
jgi:colanic acid/amylovoran biosynthesis glycosyltransferase